MELKITVSVSPHLKCQRCWRSVEGSGVHDYWPTYTICPRCVDTLLEIKWPPYILREGTTDDYYICKDEAEWHQIKLGQVDIRAL
jgi:hypothetical protein